ncbi:2-succinyl-5-enolpyruvyl-6-hydroxy-3-cyclohexene-1-carboxylate synthase [Frondihabitans sp. PAMC 28766]|uniref:2-succinyl-5-enolpyruvyl-6-hydroxy-3- cyclohexene-1-carboxylic-acid synthase n=1 Tax=Frondihabitans sp. PAMC 28766 TaxID=1795630 RepID=UPI00078D515A|nr:2-succinyl-5-enolpyruvyl-6-hydroxy-3-cyclohexene-1-carboxylic-acid synthase [Frondihabitans sp. PAMC 28766]AMM21883.1 2-succinyl-5-enolpyruvyl-6-hydroxy-3-cyclohexene-1-carboxylate synthase [Frondihabitans sp. PAMC 28766]
MPSTELPLPSGSPATDFAVVLLAELERAGVRDIVLSPGSRSQALALAAAEFERAGRLRLHVRLDERSSGFLALGLAVEQGLPAAVVTTSGTAVANLHPAVLEAHHSGVPMILLTADRPPELRGIGANQTTHQSALFGESLRLLRDVDAPGDSRVDGAVVRELVREAMSAALGRSSSPDEPATPGPVQLNIAFREPLSAKATSLPARADETEGAGSGGPAPWHPAASMTPPLALEVDVDPATVVVAGHGAGPDAEETAHLLGAPLVAEVSSGARFGRNLAPAYRELLDAPEFGGRVRRAIVFGHPTLTRQVPALLKRADVEVIVVRGPVPEAYDPSHGATVVEAVQVEASERSSDLAHREWVGTWVQTGRELVGDDDEAAPDLDAATSDDPAVRAAFLRGEVDVIRRPVTRRSLVEALWRATWPHDRLVLGASRLIREADVFVPGKKIAVHANRGLAGIDGTIATATGIGLASQAGGVGGGRLGWADGARGVTRVLVGDLTLLHDAGSLLFGEGEAKPRIQVIVGNDGGGTIFDGLEVAQVAPADAMRRVQSTPQPISFEHLAAAYGWEYVRAATRGELEQALVGSPGPVLVEVPLG